eukprot:1179953-Prorocentrum_minimum.AAC.2
MVKVSTLFTCGSTQHTYPVQDYESSNALDSISARLGGNPKSGFLMSRSWVSKFAAPPCLPERLVVYWNAQEPHRADAAARREEPDRGKPQVERSLLSQPRGSDANCHSPIHAKRCPHLAAWKAPACRSCGLRASEVDAEPGTGKKRKH